MSAERLRCLSTIALSTIALQHFLGRSVLVREFRLVRVPCLA